MITFVDKWLRSFGSGLSLKSKELESSNFPGMWVKVWLKLNGMITYPPSDKKNKNLITYFLSTPIQYLFFVFLVLSYYNIFLGAGTFKEYAIIRSGP